MSTRRPTNKHGVAHTEFAWPLLYALPAAYTAGTTLYSHGATALTWVNRARALSSGISKLNNYLQGTPPPDDTSSHVLDAASLSAGGYLMYWVGNYAYNSFIKQYGPMAKEKLVDMISHEWSRANNTVRDLKHNKKFQSQLQATVKSMHENGRTVDTKSTTPIFDGKNKNLFLLITATVAAFTHSLGAREMRRQTLRDNIKLDDNVASKMSHWDEIDTSSRTHAPQWPTDVPFLSKTIKSTYASEDYYSKQNSQIRYTDLKHVNVVRTVFNVLLGAYIQANKLIGFRVPSEDSDSIAQFSQWATMAMYWEVLAHLLHLHGWGPVYNALRLIAKVLYSDDNETSAKPTTQKRKL